MLINTAVTSVTHHSPIASYWPTRFNNTTTNITITIINISSITIITIALISSIVCSFELKCQIIKPLLSYFPGNRGSEPVTPAVVVTNIIILTFIIINTVILLFTMIILTKPVPTGWVSPNCQKASHLYSFIQRRHAQVASLACHNHHQSHQWHLQYQQKMNQSIKTRSYQENWHIKMFHFNANKFDKMCFAQMLLHSWFPESTIQAYKVTDISLRFYNKRRHKKSIFFRKKS